VAQTTLYRIREISDLFVDACVRRPDDAHLLFLSVYGRDASILQFFASFDLPTSQGGLDEFTLVDAEGNFTTVLVPDSKHLSKTVGKLPKSSLFGPVNHTWIYHDDLATPDRANRMAWGMYPTSPSEASGEPLDALAGAWQMVRDLSPVPLADEWRDIVFGLPGEPVVAWLDQSRFPPRGHIRACRINVGGDFVDRISHAVRDGVLRLTEPAVLPPTEEEQMLAPIPRAPAPKAAPKAAAEKKLLELGQVVTTASVSDDLPVDVLMQFLRRHRHGDWGDLCDEDKRINDRALSNGEDRILSSYVLTPDLAAATAQDKVWVITEWDRSVTTVLYPSEY